MVCHALSCQTIRSGRVWLGKYEISDERLCGCSGGVTRNRMVRRQQPAALWRLDILDELRGTPCELKPGSRRAAPGPLHTSFATLTIEAASSASTAGEDTDTNQDHRRRPTDRTDSKTPRDGGSGTQVRAYTGL